MLNNMSLIKPIKIGNRVFPVNIMQAPLAGFSSAVFRALIYKYSKPAFSTSEMVSCKSLLYRPKTAHARYIEKDPNEGPVCFQLFGDNVEDLAKATKIVTDLGADLIDLNCGCPVPKVRRQGAGSSLLSDPTKIYQMLVTMKQNTHLPVSVKIRVAGNNCDALKLNAAVANAVNDAGADLLVVHGRSWKEGYAPICHYDQIQFFVENVKIPVIGNGNVADSASLKQMFATGCSGVMIGRASIGQPWLIGKLIAEETKQKFIAPNTKEIGLIFIEHITRLAKFFANERLAVLEARKITKHYARGLAHKREICANINTCDNLRDFCDICERGFL